MKFIAPHRSLLTELPRCLSGEIMDLPDVDEGDHLQALHGLRRINRVSGTARRMLQPIVDLSARHKLDRLSILDVACGGGDVPIEVAVGARRLGIQVDLTLLDRSPTALRQASEAASKAEIHCRTVQADLLTERLEVSADVVTNSLFLHHIPEPNQVIGLLSNMRERAQRMVVISDLERSRLGLAAAWIGCHLLSRSAIVHHDGPASVRAAWTLNELSDFAAKAGMASVRLVPCRPWRMLLVWERRENGTPR